MVRKMTGLFAPRCLAGFLVAVPVNVFGNHFTKLTNVLSCVYLRIVHPDVLCKKYTRSNFMNKVHSKALLQDTLSRMYIIAQTLFWCTI